MDFPEEILLRIFGFIEPGARIAVLQTSKWIRNMCLLEVWKPWDNKCRGLRHAVKNGYIGYFRRWKKLAEQQGGFALSSLAHLGSNDQGSVVEIAASKGYLDFVKMFIKDPLACPSGPLDPSVNNWLAFRRACNEQQVKVIRYFLLNTNVCPSVLGEDALLLSCKRGLNKTVKVLLEDGRSCPSAMDDYCIKKACKYGHVKVVELLLNDGRANPNANGGLPIYYAYHYADKCAYEQIYELLCNDWRFRKPLWLRDSSDESSFSSSSESSYIDYPENEEHSSSG